MQDGDVVETWASIDLLKELTGFVPNTDIKHGVQMFISWYRNYYRINEKSTDK